MVSHAMDVLKVFHLFFLFLWIGSLITLTRFASINPILPLFRKAYLFFDLPLMILAVGIGIILLFMKGIPIKEGWFHMKMTFVILLVVVDAMTGRLIFHPKKRLYFQLLHITTLLLVLGILVALYILR